MKIYSKLLVTLFFLFIFFIPSNFWIFTNQNQVEISSELNSPMNIDYFIKEFAKGPLEFEQNLHKKYESLHIPNKIQQSSVEVLLNGTTKNLENESELITRFNTGIIIFNTENPVSDNMSLSTFIGIASIDFLGNWNFSSSAAINPFVNVKTGSYLYLLTFSSPGGQNGETYISNTTFIPVPEDNSIDDVNKSNYFVMPKKGFNFQIGYRPGANIGISGISHITNKLEDDFFIPASNEIASELTILSYNAEEGHKSELLLDQRIFFASWAGRQGISDIIFFIPKNKLINIQFIFNSREIGWVSRSIGPINTTVTEGEVPVTALLPIFIVEKLLNDTNLLITDIENEGINIDQYLTSLTEVEYNLDKALQNWLLSKPSFSTRGEILWDQYGIEAIYFSELSLAQIHRARELIINAYTELTSQPIGDYMLIFFIALLISLYLITQVLITSKKTRLLIQITSVLAFLVSISLIYPKSRIYLFEQGINFTNSIIFYNFYIYLTGYSLILLFIFLLKRALSNKNSLRTISTYVNISIRNLNQRKLRTIITVSTLILITTSFVLIVSVSFKGDILAEGYDFESAYDGFGIFNIQQIELDFFSFKIESRVPIQAETLLNVTLDLNNHSDLNIAMRDHIVELDTFSSDKIEINLYKTNNITNLPIFNINKSLGNYWAITPDAEKSISKLDNKLLSGSWLNDKSDNITHSEVILPQSIALDMNIKINDLLYYNFSMSGIHTTAYLKVVGIIEDDFHKISNVDGEQLRIHNYVWTNTSNSTSRMINQGIAESDQFIILNFNWWRIARAESINLQSQSLVNIAQTAPAEIIIETLDDLNDNLYLGTELADKLNPINIFLAFENKWYNFEWQIIKLLEGILPQIIPLILTVFILSQIVINSLWERKEEFELYTILGIRSHNLFLIVVTEFVIMGLIAGGLGYFLALVSFPIIKDVLPLIGIDIGSFLTQKFNSIYILLAISISTFTCILGSGPLVYIFQRRITPKKVQDKTLEKNYKSFPFLISSIDQLDDLKSFLKSKNVEWVSENFNKDSSVTFKMIKSGEMTRYQIFYNEKTFNKRILIDYMNSKPTNEYL